MNQNTQEKKRMLHKVLEEAYNSPIRQKVEENDDGEMTKIPGGMCLQNTANLIRMLVEVNLMNKENIKMLLIFPKDNTQLIIDVSVLSEDERKVIFFRRFLGIPHNWVFHVVASIDEEIVDFSLDKEHCISSQIEYFDQLRKDNGNNLILHYVKVDDIDQILEEMDKIQSSTSYDISRLRYKAEQLRI